MEGKCASCKYSGGCPYDNGECSRFQYRHWMSEKAQPKTQTKGSIMYLKGLTKEIVIANTPVVKEETKLSKKAQQVKKIIEDKDFGCKKASVAELISAVMGENINLGADKKARSVTSINGATLPVLR